MTLSVLRNVESLDIKVSWCICVINIEINVIFNVFTFRYKATWIRQFLAVFWRSWLSAAREPGVFRTRLAQAIVSIWCQNEICLG